jgi:putative hydrolase of the HAD superfamily
MILLDEAFLKGVRHLEPIPTDLSPAGALRHEIRCILFDIYGTLFVSASGDISLSEHNSPQQTKVKLLLDKYGIQIPPGELLDQFFAAIRQRHAELRHRGTEFPEVKIDRIWQQVLQLNDLSAARQFAAEFEFIANPVYPMPHLAELLSACRNQGYWMGIISNAQFFTPLLFKWFLNLDTNSLGFSRDLVFYSYMFETAKPSPALFNRAAEKLTEKTIPPAAVLYVGNDMLNDIYPAATVGFQTALFAGDRRSLRLRQDDYRCRDLKPDLVLTDLVQLIRHIS